VESVGSTPRQGPPKFRAAAGNKAEGRPRQKSKSKNRSPQRNLQPKNPIDMADENLTLKDLLA